MSTAIQNIFTLAGNAWTVIMGNPLLSLTVGLSVTVGIFGILLYIINPRKK